MQKLKASMLQQLATIRSMGFLVVTAKISVVIAAVLALYSQDLTILFTNAFQDEATIHALIIPLIFAFLASHKRRILRAVIPDHDSRPPQKLNYLSALCGQPSSYNPLLVWIVQFHAFGISYTQMLPLLAAGLVFALFNFRTLEELAIPPIFLIFLTPSPLETL